MAGMINPALLNLPVLQRQIHSHPAAAKLLADDSNSSTAKKRIKN
jgi:hypothetical protein